MLTVGTDGKQAGRPSPVPGADGSLGVPSSVLVPEWRHHSDTRAPAMATVCPFTGHWEGGLMIYTPSMKQMRRLRLAEAQ